MPRVTSVRSPRTVYLIKRAETVVRGRLKSVLQPLAVTPRQYVTLSLLRDECDQSSADLARNAGITPQSISETIATLVRKGLIERIEHPEHRRILMTRLTAAGEACLAACEAAVDELERRLLSVLDTDDLDDLRDALRAIVKADRQDDDLS